MEFGSVSFKNLFENCSISSLVLLVNNMLSDSVHEINNGVHSFLRKYTDSLKSLCHHRTVLNITECLCSNLLFNYKSCKVLSPLGFFFCDCMMPFSYLSYVVIFYNWILKVNKIKCVGEKQTLNCRFFGRNFWEEFSKNGAPLSGWDNSLWFSMHSKLQFMIIVTGRVDCRFKRRILLLKYSESLEIMWEKILSCHSWAVWSTLFTASEKFHRWGEDFWMK